MALSRNICPTGGVQHRMPRAALLTLVVVTGAACSSGQNTDCRWPEDPPRLLDLRVSSDVEHLHRDVELAEELAVRFADHSGRGPGPERQQLRVERCLEPLLAGVVSRHGVSRADVDLTQARLGERGLNLIVNIPVAAWFAVATLLTLRATRRRFAVPDETPAVVAATIASAVVLAAITTGFGRVWQMISETIRIGNGHLGGSRGFRLPWVQYSFEYFLVLMVAFLVIALVYHARRTVMARR